MTATECFLIRILSDHLASRRSASAPIDETELMNLASAHQINGIVYDQCKDFLSASVSAELDRRGAAEIRAYMSRVKLFEDVAAAFSDNGIPFYTVKGLDLAALYPKPPLRTMGDCDLVVREEDKPRAHEVLLGLGFQNGQKGTHEWTYFRSGLEFELHHRLLYDEVGNSAAAVDFVREAWDYCGRGEGSQYHLDWSFQFVFLLLHLHKHLIHSGVGFRQFMDVYLVSRKTDLNRAWIREELEKLELLAFADRVLDLCGKWFDGGELSPDDLICTEKVLRNGVFGFQDPRNRENRGADLMLRGSGPRFLTRGMFLLSCAFPSYDGMRFVPWYGGLDGRPYLLPAFWVYRWFRALKHRMASSGKRMLKTALVSEKEIENRKRDLARWGL